jgi:hypothetical protein
MLPSPTRQLLITILDKRCQTVLTHRCRSIPEYRCRQQLACGAHHEPSTQRPPLNDTDWDRWVSAEITARRDRTIAEALDSEIATTSKEVSS